MSRQSIYGVAMVVVGLAATYAFQPSLRPYVWSAIAWSIFIMSAVVVVAVVGNILVVLYRMFTGDIPEEEWRYKEISADIRKRRPSFEPRSHPNKQ
jgi:hypothetical protein